MYRVEMYARVRRACRVEGMSTREASRVLGSGRKTLRKMLSGSIQNFVLWAIVMKKKGASYGNREGTIGPAVGGA